MTNETIRNLQRIKGVGEIIARRLLELGLDTPAKIARTTEDELRRIKGLNPRTIPSIISQAAALAKDAASGKAERVDLLRQTAAGLRQTVQEIATAAKERFAEQLAGKPGKRLGRDLVRVVDTLDRLEAGLPKRARRASKGLAKAGKRLEALTEASVKRMRKGLRRARKALGRALP